MANPRCPECDGPASYGPGEPPRGTVPCERCWRAWAWLGEQQPSELVIGWARTRAEVEKLAPGADITLSRLRIVSWENRVLTLAGFVQHRRWAERRYPAVLSAVVRSEKRPVFLTPRVGATIARKIQRDKEEQ